MDVEKPLAPTVLRTETVYSVESRYINYAVPPEGIYWKDSSKKYLIFEGYSNKVHQSKIER